MSVTLSNEVLEDNVAMFRARAIAAANKRAREFGVDINQSFLAERSREAGSLSLEDVERSVNLEPGATSCE